MMNEQVNNNLAPDNSVVQTQYVDEFGNPIDPSLIDANGNYIGNQVTQYVDEYGNPIDPSLIDENGNYIGNQVQSNVETPINTLENTLQDNNINEQSIADQLNTVSGSVDLNMPQQPVEEVPQATQEPVQEVTQSEQAQPAAGGAAHQMDDKEFMQGMVTFDYNNVPITDIVNSIILDAINKGASDIHFDPFDEGIKIRVRIDGQLNDYSIVPLFVKKNMITRIKIISGMNITEQRVPQDGAIRTELQNKTIDLRVSCLPTNMGEKIVIRIMDYSMSAAGIEALDFSEKNLDKVYKMLALPNGIILVTGATGSGKSTTVYSMLQRLNVEGTNLVTVEDPIEMNIGGINQVQAQSEIGLTFAAVLRSILRQDPDVIMIGEIRDDETARIAVRASITGHLVLSTIHTNNSLNTIERLTDMSVERYLLGSSLSGIISQKLARRLCEHCKKLRPTTDYEKKVFKEALGKDIEEIYEPVGCPHCSRGYRGRIAIHEVLLVQQAVRDAITRNTPKDELRQLVYGEAGTTTMLQDGLEKVLTGATSFEEILKLIDLEDDLGSGTQLGLSDQLNEAQMGEIEVPGAIPEEQVQTTQQVAQNSVIQGGPTTINSTSPINFNLSPDMLEGLKDLFKSLKGDDEDEDIVIKKHKKRKTRVIEIDDDDIESDDEIETLEEEPIKETKVKKEKKKEEIKEEPVEEIESIDSVEDEVFNSTLQKLPEDKDINDAEDLLSRIRDNLDKIYKAKQQLNKKNLNLRVQELITATIPLVRDLKKIDDEYKFSDAKEEEIKELIKNIALNLDLLKQEDTIYKNTKKRIEKLLSVINADSKPNKTTNNEDNDGFDDIFNDLINSQPVTTKDKNIDEILKEIEALNIDIPEVPLDDIVITDTPKDDIPEIVLDEIEEDLSPLDEF